MSYKILESVIEFENNLPVRIVVLVQISKNDIRAFDATNRPTSGYFFIMPDTPISPGLLQKVAAGGCAVQRENIPEEWIKKYA